MSILAATPPVSVRQEALFAAVCLAVGLGVAAALRVFRRDRAALALPDRVGSRESVWPLVAVTAAGLFCWFAIPLGYFAYKQAALIAREGREARLDPGDLSAADLAFIATVPPVIGFLALTIGNAALRRVGRYDLGFGIRGLAPGLLRGVLASLCVMPLMFTCLVVLDWVYRAVNYQHPREHELLRALGETDNLPVEVSLLVGAALVAPLFEELLFRGHLQTILRRAFSRLGLRSRNEPVAPPVDSFDPPAAAVTPGDAQVLSYTPPVEPVEVPPPPWATWAAIGLTSLLFALVHPAWTWAPIFALSLCLGYAYERTGNLWVPIVIHAAFNSTQTALFLLNLTN